MVISFDKNILKEQEAYSFTQIEKTCTSRLTRVVSGDVQQQWTVEGIQYQKCSCQGTRYNEIQKWSLAATLDTNSLCRSSLETYFCDIEKMNIDMSSPCS
jgi:hypothetical protein